jgi:hypothetical protein
MRKISLRTILLIIAAGIWVNIIQTAGLIPSIQKVRVINTVDAHVDGSVSVDNTVDINIQEINGQQDVFYNDGLNSKKYYRLPVSGR